MSASRSVNLKELAKSLFESSIQIAERDVIDLFDYLDHSRDCHIGIDPLLELIKGTMNDFRREVVSHIFLKLDFEGKGFLNLDDFAYLYSAKRHPLVVSNSKTESQIIDELIRSFEDYLAILVLEIY
jgi:Ca2+-binding EF-hand superfamily protein